MMKINQTRFLTAIGLLGYNYIGGYLLYKFPLNFHNAIISLIQASFIGIFILINYFYLQWYEKIIQEQR